MYDFIMYLIICYGMCYMSLLDLYVDQLLFYMCVNVQYERKDIPILRKLQYNLILNHIPVSYQEVSPSVNSYANGYETVMPIMGNTGQYPCSRQRLRPSDPGCCPTFLKNMSELNNILIRLIIINILSAISKYSYMLMVHSVMVCWVMHNCCKQITILTLMI